MQLYCDQGKGKRGRPRTTLPVVLWAESRQVLKNEPNLKRFIELAQNRDSWREFVEKVVAKSLGDVTVRTKHIKKVACASDKVHIETKWVNKVN